MLNNTFSYSGRPETCISLKIPTFIFISITVLSYVLCIYKKGKKASGIVWKHPHYYYITVIHKYQKMFPYWHQIIQYSAKKSLNFTSIPIFPSPCFRSRVDYQVLLPKVFMVFLNNFN